jgi:hypothetical protein
MVLFQYDCENIKQQLSFWMGMKAAVEPDRHLSSDEWKAFVAIAGAFRVHDAVRYSPAHEPHATVPFHSRSLQPHAPSNAE